MSRSEAPQLGLLYLSKTKSTQVNKKNSYIATGSYSTMKAKHMRNVFSYFFRRGPMALLDRGCRTYT
jgi:hypothetical protein